MVQSSSRKVGKMRTKVLATIGPASESPEMIEKLINEGMDIVRFNFSHGDQPTHGQRIDAARAVAKKLNKTIQIFCDLQGPKIRVRQFENEPKKLVDGQKVILTTSVNENIQPDHIVIEDPYLHADLKAGDIIMIDDGLLELIVDEINSFEIFCTVVHGGDLYARKGVNVPLTKTTTNSLTEKDISDLKFSVGYNPDWIAISFVQTAEDVRVVRKHIKEMGGSDSIRIMAKIERANALDNIHEIIQEADGITVARGDLGVEIPFEKVPLIQKEIIKRCNFAGKPVITATQMLSSMVHSPVPTRAEVSDIANAVFDGSDAVWLSNETTVGEYPVEALRTLIKVAKAAEDYRYNRTNKF
jgi:pyruvate kinase